jgi:hypothetical protein
MSLTLTQRTQFRVQNEQGVQMDVELHVCDTCGAVVVKRLLHNEWHQRVEPDSGAAEHAVTLSADDYKRSQGERARFEALWHETRDTAETLRAALEAIARDRLADNHSVTKARQTLAQVDAQSTTPIRKTQSDAN